MENKEIKPVHYSTQLQNQLKQLEKRINEALLRCQENPTDENIRNLNNLRTDQQIIASRIENQNNQCYMPDILFINQ